MEKICSLDSLKSSPSLKLVDSSAYNPFTNCQKFRYSNEYFDDTSKFMISMITINCKNPTFFSTRGIFEEIVSYNYSNGLEETQGQRARLNHLVQSIKENKNKFLFNLNEQEMKTYDELKANFSYVQRYYGLKDPDFELLLSGLTVGLLKGSCSIISNDDYIFKALNKEIIKRHDNVREVISFYHRLNFPQFRQKLFD